MNSYKIKKGRWGENVAAEFLQKRGYGIIERNYRCRAGEVDIIAEKSGVIHFVEVKTRSGEKFGSPLEAINYYKMSHIINTAGYYIYIKGLEGFDISIDAIGICGDRIEFIEGINI